MLKSEAQRDQLFRLQPSSARQNFNDLKCIYIYLKTNQMLNPKLREINCLGYSHPVPDKIITS